MEMLRDAGERCGRTYGGFLVFVLAAGAAGLLVAEPAEAQDGRSDAGLAVSKEAFRLQPDFFFSHPRVSVGVRGGFQLRRAESDVYEFLTEELTLERADLDGFAFGADLGVRITDRVDLVFSAEHARAREQSEFRGWVGDDGLPIEQETRLQTTPITAGLKAYLQPRGEAVGRFVWIPSRFAPFVGAGAGFIHYRLEQEGEFVDFQDLAIFRDHFLSEDWGGTAHLLAGADLRLTRRTLLTGEARYRWASGDMGGDFQGFEPIDLSGLQASLGVTFRF